MCWGYFYLNRRFMFFLLHGCHGAAEYYFLHKSCSNAAHGWQLSCPTTGCLIVPGSWRIGGRAAEEDGRRATVCSSQRWLPISEHERQKIQLRHYLTIAPVLPWVLPLLRNSPSIGNAGHVILATASSPSHCETREEAEIFRLSDMSIMHVIKSAV